ncbi:MAG TPA: type II toxin-antitoxin system VapC family toxin [Agitococcus sp.]|nr:type II toxin-antitoxin system VapC family toxin [Agitococcus sp.]
MYLLDTNTCIQLWQRKNITVRQHFLACRPREIALCSVVKAELWFGAQRSQQPTHNMQLLQTLFAPIQSWVFDDNAAHYYAQIRADLAAKGQLIGANDMLIAAIALAHQATLVTHNTREFQRVLGLNLVDWEL